MDKDLNSPAKELHRGSVSQTLANGTVLDGNVEILELIGQGGMSAIYRGRHLAMDREVAVKVLKTALPDENSKRRFMREALALTTFEQPNIARAYSFGYVDDGKPYLVMELLRGRSLSAVIESEGALDPSRAVPIFNQLCDALSEVHRRGLVHRDVKPSNIMLVDNDTQVKLIDFGIVKLLPESGNDAQKLTATAAILGSPQYMSPEQCLGEALDARSDIYSLGCLMYETICGRPPFEAETAFAVVHKHLNEDLEPQEMLETPIGNVIRWCLEKSPADRPQSVDDVKHALATPKFTRPPRWRPTRNRNGIRTKLLIAGCLVLSVLVSIQLAPRVQELIQKKTPRTEVNTPYDNVIAQKHNDEAIARTNEIVLMDSASLNRAIEACNRWDDYVAPYCPLNNSANIQHVSALHTLGLAYFRGGAHRRSTDAYRRCVEEFERLNPDDDWSRLSYLSALAAVGTYYAEPSLQDQATLSAGQYANLNYAIRFMRRSDRVKSFADISQPYADLSRLIDRYEAKLVTLERDSQDESFTPNMAEKRLGDLEKLYDAADKTPSLRQECLQETNKLISLTGAHLENPTALDVYIRALDINIRCWRLLGQLDEAERSSVVLLSTFDETNGATSGITSSMAHAATQLAESYMTRPEYAARRQMYLPAVIDLCHRLDRLKNHHDPGIRSFYQHSRVMLAKARRLLKQGH